MYVAETHGAYDHKLLLAAYNKIIIIVLKLVQIAAAKFNDLDKLKHKLPCSV